MKRRRLLEGVIAGFAFLSIPRVIENGLEFIANAYAQEQNEPPDQQITTPTEQHIRLPEEQETRLPKDNLDEQQHSAKDLVQRAIALVRKYGREYKGKSINGREIITYSYTVSFDACTTSEVYHATLDMHTNGRIKSFALVYEVIGDMESEKEHDAGEKRESPTTDTEEFYRVLEEANFVERYINGKIEPDKDEYGSSNVGSMIGLKESSPVKQYHCSQLSGSVIRNSKLVCLDNKEIQEQYRITLKYFLAMAEESKGH
ncbi:MAG: hypothetical protein ABIG89_02645 [Candidatus Woesearchaeota archaeon]